MSVGAFCNREVVVATPDTGIAALARLMRHHHVGDVVIVDNSDPAKVMPLGIVTDRDLVMELLAKAVAPDSVTAGDLLADRLVTAHEQDSLWHTIKRMRASGIRRMVVVDDHTNLIGILTLDDIMELLADELSTLAKIPGQELAREAIHRD